MLTFQDIEVQRQVELLTGERAVCYGTVTASACEGECMSSSLSTLHSATGFIKVKKRGNLLSCIEAN